MTKSICLVTPSLKSGGAERVMSTLANYFSSKKNLKVHLINLTGGEEFYALNDSIEIHRPNFNYNEYNRVIFSLKILFFLRDVLKKVRPNSVLSFGGRYNAFVLFASVNLKIPVYISERSKPGISYGKFIDFINRILYKRARGIIAQTELAKKILKEKTNHSNISVIGNPIRNIKRNDSIRKDNIILNVGRFISTKNQKILVDFFDEINLNNWRLIFLGDGPLFDEVKKYALTKNLSDKIFFDGNVKDVDKYYNMARVFAFTSTSEGFPNVLGEAMNAGLASISFDCNSGPSDLIDDGINGYLVKEGDLNDYKKKLEEICLNEELRELFEKNALIKIKNYDLEFISNRFYNFLLEENA